MKAKTGLFILAPILLTTACVHSHRTVVYEPLTAPPVAATSDRPEQRVYAEPVLPPGEPGTPAAKDLTIASSVREAIRGEIHLPSDSDSVAATIDNGVVTLRGTMPSENERVALVDRISKTPGVKRVIDEITVDQR